MQDVAFKAAVGGQPAWAAAAHAAATARSAVTVSQVGIWASGPGVDDVPGDPRAPRCPMRPGRRRDGICVGGEPGADALAHLQAHQAGGCQHDGVVLTFVELAQAVLTLPRGASIPRSGRSACSRGLATQAGGADHGLGQLVQRYISVGDKGVARVFARHRS